MPTYDYECEACGHKMEVFQGINDPLLTKCPECKKKKFKRLFGAGAAIVFKGTGFYQTDYRSESYKSSAAADKPAADCGSCTPSTCDNKATPAKETKTESKPTKKDSKK
jgi:putative FmdB family regulatory protein